MFFFLIFFWGDLILLLNYVSMGGKGPVLVEARRHQIPLKLALQAAVSSLTWVLGIKRRSSARALYTLNH